MYFADAALDDFLYDAMDAPVQTRRRAIALAVDALDEAIDEAVHPVTRRGGTLRVDRTQDLSRMRNEEARRRRIRQEIGPGQPGIWVTSEAEARRVAAEAGYPIPANAPLEVDQQGRGQPHFHGQSPSGFRSSHIFVGDPPPTTDFADAFEDALVDSLEAEDTDEFFRRLARGIGRVARRVGRGIGQVARVVGPIASAIPLPWTQAIGRVAQVAGRLMADGADEFEAIDALIDLAEAEDLWDAAAPAIATLAVHGTLPQVSRLPTQTRQQVVQATTQAAQAIVRQQGAQAVRALPSVVQTAQQIARQQNLPLRTLPQVIQQVGRQLSQNPQRLRRLASTRLSSTRPSPRPRPCACSHSSARRLSRST